MNTKRVIEDKHGILTPDDGIFYQVEPIDFLPSGNIKRIRLDNNYKYCEGVALFTPFTGLTLDGIIGIKQYGNFIFDKLPMLHLFSDTVDNVNGSFLKTNFKAGGSLIEFYYESISNVPSDYFYVIFKLTNKRPTTINKKYGYNVLNLNIGFNSGKFLFNYNKNIKKISFYRISSSSSYNAEITIRDSSRFYFKKMPFDFVSKLNVSDINKRFIDCDAPTDNLMYEINAISIAADLFVVFEYED